MAQSAGKIAFRVHGEVGREPRGTAHMGLIGTLTRRPAGLLAAGGVLALAIGGLAVAAIPDADGLIQVATRPQARTLATCASSTLSNPPAAQARPRSRGTSRENRASPENREKLGHLVPRALLGRGPGVRRSSAELHRRTQPGGAGSGTGRVRAQRFARDIPTRRHRRLARGVLGRLEIRRQGLRPGQA